VRSPLGHPLQAGSGVDRVSDRGVVEALLRADVPRHHRATVQADPDLKLLAHATVSHPLVEPRQALRDHLVSRRQGPIGVVLALDGGTEHGHDPVPDERDQRSAVGHHGSGHFLVVAVEDFEHFLRLP
jgi:hypothetical protein